MVKKKPTVTKEMLEYLTEVYPDRCPDLSRTEKEVWFASGQASVVRHLQSISDSQLERAMNQ